MIHVYLFVFSFYCRFTASNEAHNLVRWHHKVFWHEVLFIKLSRDSSFVMNQSVRWTRVDCRTEPRIMNWCLACLILSLLYEFFYTETKRESQICSRWYEIRFDGNFNACSRKDNSRLGPKVRLATASLWILLHKYSIISITKVFRSEISLVSLSSMYIHQRIQIIYIYDN